VRYLGVDITGSNRRWDWTLIDDEKKSVLSGQGSAKTLLGVVESDEPDIIAVDGPSAENCGLMRRAEIRHAVLGERATAKETLYENYRVSEADLGLRGIHCYVTPQCERADLSDWVRVGLDLYEGLAERYSLLREPGQVDYRPGQKLMIEVYPHASFVVALGWIPQLKTSLGGCLERIACLVLWAERLGFDLPEMSELVPLLKNMDMKRIAENGAPDLRHDKLDALSAAFTAKSVADGTAWALGNTADGVIVLPKKPLEKYTKRLGSRAARLSSF
jgi:hypothetical protein